MGVFPHFHWISIDGKRPNIPENYIREESKGINPLGQESFQNINKSGSDPNYTSQNGNKKVVPPIIHNISKELQIFLENFEQRFRKEIKNSKLNPNPLFTISKELEVSLNVIQNEPGVVELIPYIIEFLMNSLANKQSISDSRVHMVILHYADALLKNNFFYLEPYLHQLVTLILSLILMDTSDSEMELVLEVKDFAVSLMKLIFKK